MLPKQDNNSQLSEISKEKNAVFLSTQPTNMLFQSTLTKEMTLIFASSPKELLKESGNFALTSM